jgi:SAM-dependent methyltransferase
MDDSVYGEMRFQSSADLLRAVKEDERGFSQEVQMKIGIVPESLLERVVLASGMAPTALAESWFPYMLARTIMVGTRLGVFEALEAGPLDAAQVAESCGTVPRATEKLLNALVGCGYVRCDGKRYTLAPVARRWLLASSPESCRDKVLFQFIEWDWFTRCEEFLRSGNPIGAHEHMTDAEWGLYQRGMRSGIEPMVKDVVGRLRVPKGARRMLDIGGSHGYWSVSFCRRYPQLRATVLDLPQAIPHAAPILAREGMGDRIEHRAGDALKDELGDQEYDLVFLASLVHHFDAATNRSLMKRVARALRPSGVVAIFDGLRLVAGERIGQLGGLMDLFFAMTSESGTWSPAEMAEWQREAGLSPRKVMRLRIARDVGVQAAMKPALSSDAT